MKVAVNMRLKDRNKSWTTRESWAAMRGNTVPLFYQTKTRTLTPRLMKIPSQSCLRTSTKSPSSMRNSRRPISVSLEWVRVTCVSFGDNLLISCKSNGNKYKRGTEQRGQRTETLPQLQRLLGCVAESVQHQDSKGTRDNTKGKVQGQKDTEYGQAKVNKGWTCKETWTQYRKWAGEG